MAKSVKKPVSDLFETIDSNALQSVDNSSRNRDSGRIHELEDEIEEQKRQLVNSLVPQEDGTWLLFNTVKLTKVGLDVPADFNDEDKYVLGEIIVGMQGATQFWMGDWANLYLDEDMDDNQRGDVYTELAQKFKIEHKTLNNYASVCRKIRVSLRRETMTFTHHRLVAEMPEPLKGREEHFLNAAVEGQWSVRQLREEIQKERDKLDPPAQPDTLIDTKHMKKQFNQVTKLFSADVSKFSAKKRDEYRGKVAALESILQDLKNKLDE